MAEGGPEIRPAFRRFRAPRRQLHLVPEQPSRRQDRPEGRRALRRRRSQIWDLYHFPAEPGDKGWYSKNPTWHQQWYDEIKELVDNYHPDLLYTDGGVPFGNEVGLSMIAHLYNQDAARPRRQGARSIYNCKQKSEGRWVEDLERGIMPKIDPYPWQTDTSIGDWFYNRNWKFRPVSWVIHMLVDNVSKNGNLLLNVVQRPDGSLDPGGRKRCSASWPTGTPSTARPSSARGPGWFTAKVPSRCKGGTLQGGLQVQCPGDPFHHQGRDALRHRARLAGGRPARPSARSPNPPAKSQQHHQRQPARLLRANSNGSRPPMAWS